MSDLFSFHHFGFTSPGYLFLLLLIPLLYVFRAVVRRRRAQYTVAFTNLRILRAVAGSRRSSWRRRVPLVVLALALTTSAAALARPSVQIVRAHRQFTVMLVADVSGSMEATDVAPSRLDATISAMRQFVDHLPKSDEVGLVTFSDKVQVLATPTTNRAAVDQALDVLKAQGGTALGEGVVAAVRIVLASLASAGIHHTPGQSLPAAILLESDGAQDRGTVTPFAAAQLAKKAGIRIYGIALGTRHGSITRGTGLLRESIAVPPSPGTVGMLASQTSGESFNATNAGTLDGIFRGLEAGIARRREQTEITSWFELAAAVLLVAGVAAARVWGSALP